MNNNTPTTPDPRNLQIPQRDSVNNGQQQATHYARAQVEQVYSQQAQTMQPAAKHPAETTSQENPYQRTHKDYSQADLQKYHTAWQQYYQQYYQHYYTQQLQAERQKQAAQKATEAAKPTSTPNPRTDVITSGNTSINTEPTNRLNRVSELKNDLRKKVKERAQKARKSNHFVPIASALGVVLLFLFLQFNNMLVAQVQAYVSPGGISQESIIIDPSQEINVGPEPKLIIPKINVDVPIDFAVTTLDENEIQRSLRDGVTHYKLPGANAKPGQFGNTVLLGHSSNDIFNQGEYKFVFVLLDRMQPGDTFYIHYEGKRYIYKITESKIIDPTDIAALQIGRDKPMATLITCTPPGTDLQRLIVFAEQISPEPSNDRQQSNRDTAEDQAVDDAKLPGVESNWLDSLWRGLF